MNIKIAKSLSAILLMMLLLLAIGANAQYRNPVLRGMNPDPSIIRIGYDYYLATSSFEYFPSCPIYHSLDLVHWQLIGYALSRPSQFALLKSEHPSTYATTLRYDRGVFYLITTDVRAGVNFYVTATNPAGPWSDPIAVDHGMFDPSLFFDTDGTAYYTRRGPGPSENILQATIDIQTGRLTSPLRTISRGMVTDDAEGPHLYKIQGGYYLIEAEGGTRFLHMETVGRSKSPWGPFEPDPANPWVAQHTSWDYPVRSVGHCELTDTPDGNWWTTCLGTRHPSYASFSLGRETFLYAVKWRDGWPTVKPQDIEQLQVDEPVPPAHPWPATPARDDFNAPVLGLDWNTIGPLGASTYSLSERPGFLRLHGQEALLSFASPAAFVGRRQTEWKGQSVAQMEFEPASANEEAGLTVFMSPNFHYEIFKTVEDGHPVVVLRKKVGDMQVLAAEIEVHEGAILLRIDSDADQYRFYYAESSDNWKLLGTGLERMISSEVANVWTGAYIGMYSSGNGKKCTVPADFDWFEYKTSE
jgi:alpha-N-arabinofuranosidase